jgi:hypothetical protein
LAHAGFPGSFRSVGSRVDPILTDPRVRVRRTPARAEVVAELDGDMRDVLGGGQREVEVRTTRLQFDARLRGVLDGA